MEQLHDSLPANEPIRPRILIVEDEARLVKGLETTLSDKGYAVDLVQTGGGALDAFKRNEFDLLIASLRLPDMDGMKVIKQVKQDRPDTAVIAITGDATVSSAVAAMKLGVHDYLSKPFAENELLSVIGDALRLRKERNNKAFAEAAPPVAEMAAPEPSPGDLKRVKKILASFKHQFAREREEIIPMLQSVQNEIGYIPEAAMEGIADLTRTPSAAVYGITTFYEQFRMHPVGRHIVKVCRGTACHVKGAERILNELEARFQLSPGQTSPDRKFTLETVACFGSCAIAPVVVVNNSVQGRMNPAKTCKSLSHVDQNENSPNGDDGGEGV